MERFNTLSGMGEHKAGLTRHKAGACYVDVVLVALEFDRKGCDVVVDLTVVHDLMGQTPVISLSHSHLEDLEVTAGTSEHVLEPGQQGLDG
jgi:hypothetical protein